MLNGGEEVQRLSLRVDRNQLLIEVRLDALIELEVNILAVSWELQPHDYFAALHHSELSYLWWF